eukprot:TRINITY_DN3989_c0_g2_i1.p1 TRINITY_DN3989_c0_g2~~TRINITY_DN3989_c0_g2_i1.p1  ORF type:complete len:329 (+),score=95.19 TRINITY_DN3989_c0_g2_i1:110-1096(+)
MYEEPTIADLVKDKSGPELFKELYRQLPLVEYQDYYKNGVWQNDLMRLDIEVIDAHRKEAGAPDVAPLEELEFPELPPPVQVPSVQPLVRPGMPLAGTPAAAAAEALARLSAQQQAVGGVAPIAGTLPAGAAAATSPIAAAGAVVVPPVAGVLPVTVPPVTVALPGQVPAPKAAVVVPVPAAGVVVPPLVTPVAPVVPPRPLEHKDIALFVSTWKLDPNKAKAALEKLTPARRRYVMQNFKGAAANGASPAEKLEEYVAECEKSSAWDVDASATSTVGSNAADAAGVKRPLEETAEDPNKRQNTGVVTSKAASKAATVMSKAGSAIKP